MELAAEEPRVIGQFYDLDKLAIRRAARDNESMFAEYLLKFGIELIAVAVTLEDSRLAVDPFSETARLQLAFIETEAHCASHLFNPNQIAQFINNAIGRVRIELCAVGTC